MKNHLLAIVADVDSLDLTNVADTWRFICENNKNVKKKWRKLCNNRSLTTKWWMLLLKLPSLFKLKSRNRRCEFFFFCFVSWFSFCFYFRLLYSIPSSFFFIIHCCRIVRQTHSLIVHHSLSAGEFSTVVCLYFTLFDYIWITPKKSRNLI